jgi:hypothetical protein
MRYLRHSGPLEEGGDVRRVALVGSNCGNLHRLGSSDAAQLIRSVQDQLGRDDVPPCRLHPG